MEITNSDTPSQGGDSMSGMITRRRMLRSSAATGVGLLAAGSGFPVLGQDKPESRPAGGLRRQADRHPPHRVFRSRRRRCSAKIVTDFAEANNAELDISTTNPESFGDFLGKMTAAVKAGNPPDLAYTRTSRSRRCTCSACSRTSPTWSRRRSASTATSCRASIAAKTASSTASGRRCRSSPPPPASSSAATS